MTRCAATVHSYIASVHTVLDHITQPAGPAAIGGSARPRRPTPGPQVPAAPSPTPAGTAASPPPCATPSTKPSPRSAPPVPTKPIRAVSCWDPHTWNPTSDHPRGRACDLFPTRAGTFPTGTDLANGWRIATWLRAHATALHISYLIWQDRYWSPTTPDTPGSWGIPYDGGGIYNIHDPTGGHYDHVHASVTT